MYPIIKVAPVMNGKLKAYITSYFYRVAFFTMSLFIDTNKAINKTPRQSKIYSFKGANT